MQIKKEEVKERILQAAEAEFLELGYEKASIRRIIKSAKTTIGNFYNYFEGKEAVFTELIEEVYNMFIYVIENHHKWNCDNSLWESQDVNVWRVGLLQLIKPMMPKLDNRFLLLMDCSKGTKYETAKDKLIDVLTKHFIEHIEEFSLDYPHADIGPILSKQLISGMVESLRSTDNIDKRSELLIEQVLFFAIGTMGILSGRL